MKTKKILNTKREIHILSSYFVTYHCRQNAYFEVFQFLGLNTTWLQSVQNTAVWVGVVKAFGEHFLTQFLLMFLVSSKMGGALLTSLRSKKTIVFSLLPTCYKMFLHI